MAQFDCHPQQAFFAQRGIWASRAMEPALSAADGSRTLRRNNRALGSLPYRIEPPPKCQFPFENWQTWMQLTHPSSMLRRFVGRRRFWLWRPRLRRRRCRILALLLPRVELGLLVLLVLRILLHRRSRFHQRMYALYWRMRHVGCACAG